MMHGFANLKFQLCVALIMSLLLHAHI